MNRAVSTLKEYSAMKDEKKLEILLTVIQRIYDKNPEMQEVIDASIIEILLCSTRLSPLASLGLEDGSYPEHVFFYLAFSLLFLFFFTIIMAILEKI